jgi:putative ABC transport system permease protein
MAPHLPVSATAQTYHVSGGFFRTLGIPLEAGRDFVPTDHRARPRCAIISRSFAERYLPPGDPLGQHVVLADDPRTPLTVIGVAGDVRPDVRPGEPVAPPQIYLPGLENPAWDFNLVIAAERDPDALVPLVRRTIRQVSPDTMVFNVARLETRIAESRSDTRSFAGLMSVLAGAALAMAVLAIYALVVSMIQRETRDIAVRRVLGAGPGTILRLALVRGLAPVLLGIVLGLGGAVVLARTLSTVLFNVAPLDPATFLLVPLLFATAALAASLLAAQKALEIEPMAALRAEG